jgi:hypothetical protein
VADQRIEKWLWWLNEQIKPAVLTMFHHRQIYLGLDNVIRENQPLPDSAFWPYHRNVYAASQAVAIRRQVDQHKDVASLGKLLSELADDSERITEDWWVQLWGDDPHDVDFARRRWADEFAAPGADHLDPAKPSDDLKSLEEKTAQVKDYVDQYVAHSEYRGKEPAEVSLTFREIHESIDHIGMLFRRYYGLFTAADMIRLEPVIQHDWLAPFRRPWIG